MDWFKKNLHYLIFGILSLIIMFPLFSMGFIFSVDGSFSPSIKNSDYLLGIEGQNSQWQLFRILQEITEHIIPAQIYEKIMYFFIFFISAVSMYKLVKTKNKMPKYFAAILYMINPFIYMRFMVGHLGVLISYSLMPFVILSIIKFYKKPGLKQTVRTSLWLSIIGLQIQYLLFAFMILAVFFSYFIVKKYKINYRQILLLVLFFLILNSYWLLPLFINQNQGAIDVIGSEDLSVFATNREIKNIFATTAMMYGFWRQDAYALPTDIIPNIILIAIFVVLVYLCISGYISSKDEYKTPVLILGLISLFLAVGIAHQLTKPIFTFLFNNFPFFKALREPNKFVGILVIMYCYLGALGVDSLLKHKSKLKYLSYGILVLPFIYTPVMFGSFWGQVHSTQYPSDWYYVNDYLNKNGQDFNSLSLPWHMYMDYHWINNNDKRAANLARIFFDKPVITGDNVELGSINSHSISKRSGYIESLIYNSSVGNLGRKLQILNIKYILLAKEIDYGNYLYLLNQSDLKLVINSTNFYVFRNKVKVNKFYQSDDLVMLEPLGYVQDTKIKYKIDTPQRKYVIFAEDYNPYWQLGSQTPLTGYPVNAFEYNGDDVLRFKRFNLILAGYIVSLVGLIVVLGLLFKRG